MPAQVYDETNIFARILRSELPCTKVLETAAVLAFMDIMPRADGHVLVVPKAPARTLLDIEPDSLGKLIVEVQRIARAVKQALVADGITIWQFNESAGGQEVPHLHFHIVPRWNGVELRPRTGAMEKPEVLTALAQKIASAIESGE
jgi:histidine triad (HIT) family protein